jgi:hypothetical protein
VVGEGEEVMWLCGEGCGELEKRGGIADGEVVGGDGCVVGDAKAFRCWGFVVGGFALDD